MYEYHGYMCWVSEQVQVSADVCGGLKLAAISSFMGIRWSFCAFNFKHSAQVVTLNLKDYSPYMKKIIIIPCLIKSVTTM